MINQEKYEIMEAALLDVSSHLDSVYSTIGRLGKDDKDNHDDFYKIQEPIGAAMNRVEESIDYLNLLS